MKKIVALTIVLLFIFSFGMISFANNSLTPGEALQEVELLKGTGASLGEDEELTREALITILARMHPEQGFEKFEYDGYSGFEDVPNDHWSAKYIAFAKGKNITSGIGNNKFGLGQKVTGRQAVTFFTKLLGAERVGDFYSEDAWMITQKIKEETGIDFQSISIGKIDSNLKRKDIFNLMIEALNNKPVKMDKTLGEKINKEINSENLDYISYYNHQYQQDNQKYTVNNISKYATLESINKALRNIEKNSKLLANKVKEWKNGEKQVVEPETVLELLNSKNIESVGYESYEIFYDDHFHGYMDIKSNIGITLSKLYSEGKATYNVQSSEGMSDGSLIYKKTHKIGNTYYTFVIDETFGAPNEHQLIIIEDKGNGLKLYFDLTYGIGNNIY